MAGRSAVTETRPDCLNMLRTDTLQNGAPWVYLKSLMRSPVFDDANEKLSREKMTKCLGQ